MKIYSFGYKYGEGKPEADVTFDLRNKLRNPVSHLPKGAIGLDRIVINTVLGSDANKKVFSKVFRKITKHMKKHGDDISIAFGCTSGIHRSVVFAEEFARQFAKKKCHLEVTHVHLKGDKS